MGYNSALKRNELSSHEQTWRKLNCILLRERSQSEKAAYCMIPPIQVSREVKITELESRMMVAGGWGERGLEDCLTG